MKYSIIIPAYNAEQHLNRTLESIRAQSFTDYELIVVCDSCMDNTEDVAKQYGAITVKVDYHNTGMTRNKGIELASGEYILFMDDDDWFLHEFVLEELAKRLAGCDVVIFGFIWKGVGYAPPVRENREVFPAVWCKAWKREAIGNTRFPDTFPEDVPFTTEILNKPGIKVGVFDTPLYYYNYMREGSVTQIKTDKGELMDYRRDAGMGRRIL